jgi:transposase
VVSIAAACRPASSSEYGCNSSTDALIAHLKLEIEKLRRALYGSHSERKARLLEQMELQLEDLEAAATEDELAAENAAARTQTVQLFQRKRPSRKPFPDHLPRERIIIAAPDSCPCCGSLKLSKLGEDITETLEVIPAAVEGDPDGAGAVLVPQMRDDLPATGAVPCDAARLCRAEPAGDDPVREIRPASAIESRQSERYRREGIDLSVSTLADQVGACTTVLRPPHALIERDVLAAERLHGDDMIVPILAKSKTVTGAHLDLCPRRSAVWRSRAASGAVLRPARSQA